MATPSQELKDEGTQLGEIRDALKSKTFGQMDSGWAVWALCSNCISEMVVFAHDGGPLMEEDDIVIRVDEDECTYHD